MSRIETFSYAPKTIAAHGVQEWMFVPGETNTETARAVLARPQEYGFAVQRAACLWLRDHGDWLDRERARLVLQVLDAEARKAMLQRGSNARFNGAIRQTLTWMVIAIWATLAAFWLLHIGQKAYGQYQHDAARFAAGSAVQE